MQTISFHEGLYPRAAVDAAVAAWSDLAQFSVADAPAGTTVSVSHVDPDYESFGGELLDAFANHVLFEAISLRRAGESG